MTKRVLLLCLLLAGLSPPGSSPAAEWRVTPIRLEFDRGARSGVVTVINEGEEPLQVQMKAYEWSQDAEGKDRYEETGDIVFFPKIMVVDRKEERILRAGIRVPATRKEKTYRLFIEEVPAPRKSKGTNVSIAIRFGVPVFVRPLTEEPKGEIDSLGMTGGVVGMAVRNAGNRHFVIRSILVDGINGKGEKVYSREISGWYLLAGASRSYSTEVPQDVCGDLARITVEVRTDLFALPGELIPDKSMCAP